MDEDKDTIELQSLMEVITYEEEVAIDVVTLAIKSPNTVWKNQQDYKVLEWKLYDSCGVHSLRMQHVYIYMLVEKRYPLTPSTITDMLNKKLQYKVNAAEGVNAASEEVNTAELNPKGIFINQSKYAYEMLKKYGLESCDDVETLIVERSKLDEDPQGTPVDPTRYRNHTLEKLKSLAESDEE
ncbi:hypothetical protein Tco_1454592 [Tanacetum coccineum]